MFNCHLKLSFRETLFFIIHLVITLLLLKRLHASALLVATVRRFCSTRKFFCIRYRWPPIHKTRLPARLSLVALLNYSLLRVLMILIRTLKYCGRLRFFSKIYLLSRLKLKCCFKRFILIITSSMLWPSAGRILYLLCSLVMFLNYLILCVMCLSPVYFNINLFHVYVNFYNYFSMTLVFSPSIQLLLLLFLYNVFKFCFYKLLWFQDGVD